MSLHMYSFNGTRFSCMKKKILVLILGLTSGRKFSAIDVKRYSGYINSIRI